jgi:hypothetical protein
MCWAWKRRSTGFWHWVRQPGHIFELGHGDVTGGGGWEGEGRRDATEAVWEKKTEGIKIILSLQRARRLGALVAGYATGVKQSAFVASCWLPGVLPRGPSVTLVGMCYGCGASVLAVGPTSPPSRVAASIIFSRSQLYMLAQFIEPISMRKSPSTVLARSIT